MSRALLWQDDGERIRGWGVWGEYTGLNGVHGSCRSLFTTMGEKVCFSLNTLPPDDHRGGRWTESPEVSGSFCLQRWLE